MNSSTCFISTKNSYEISPVAYKMITMNYSEILVKKFLKFVELMGLVSGETLLDQDYK